MESITKINTLTNNNLPINYDDDILLNNTLYNMELSETSYNQYKYTIIRFLETNKISFTELIDTISNNQHDRIENNMIIKYNPQNSLLKRYYDNHINECKIKGNKNSSIQARIRMINSVLKQCGIITPKIKLNTNDNHKKAILLTNKDIKHIIDNYCNIHQKALITFIASTGIRRGDSLNFTIGDFLMATYNKTYDIDEFLNNYVNNMVGYWEFTPHKTQKTGLICKVCNSGESSNYIVESLKQRKISIEKYNSIHNTNLKLTNDTPLFSNKHSHYIGKISTNGITNVMREKNNLFKEYKIKSIEDDRKNGKISPNEYEKLKNNVPLFSLHQLRHYFISVLRHYTNNRDIALIMEAHTSDIRTDKNYIGESEELFNEETIRKTYSKIEKYLTFNSNISLEKTEQLENDYNKLLEENKELKNLIDKLEPMKERLNKLFEREPFKKLMEKRI